jgi:phage-related protein
MAADGSVVIEVNADDSKAESKFKALGNMATQSMKAVGIAAGVAAGAVVALGKQAITAYAEYEQLVGGVETLFKESADIVQDYANNAYKTAGLSANEYMSTVTSFSASLLQSLGGDTAAAAKAADTAITDMADNANKMGTSMESIQNAYQGFAKNNYTMLDNLKLGYGGTADEMARLLADAQEISGIEYDIKNLSDVYAAVHVIQTELGITGTTAKEAGSTIQGSAAAMGSAWDNLLVGMADDTQDFDKLLTNFLDSVGVFGKNLIPRIQVALGGVTKLISGLGPQLAGALPGMIQELLPGLTEAALGILQALADGLQNDLPMLQRTIMGALENLLITLMGMYPQFVDIGMEFLIRMVSGIGEALPEIAGAASDMISELVDAIIDNLPLITEAAFSIVLGLATAITENLSDIMTAGLTLFTALVAMLPEIITDIVAVLPEIITAIIDALLANLPLIIEAGITLLVALVDALPQIIEAIVAVLPDIINAIVNATLDNLPLIIGAGVTLFVALIGALPEIITTIVSAIPEIISGIIAAFGKQASRIKDIGKSLLEGIWKGIMDAKDWLVGKVEGFFDGIVGGIKDTLGIRSPSRVFARIGEQMAAGVGVGYADGIKDVEAEMARLSKQMTSAVEAEIGAVSLEAAVQAEGARAQSGLTREIRETNNTIEKVVAVEGDGITGELIRMLGLKLKQEEKRVGAPVPA